jgi:hypothetical protein
MQVLNKVILGLVGLLMVITSLTSIVVAKESKLEYKQDGMIFVVGKHEPKKRVNPKVVNKVTEKVVVKEKIIQKMEVVKGHEEYVEQNDASPGQLIRENNISEEGGLAGSIKKMVNNLKNSIENILSRLGIIEDKMKNVDSLVETTSKLTDEVIEQNIRLDSIEDVLLKKDTANMQ